MLKDNTLPEFNIGYFISFNTGSNFVLFLALLYHRSFFENGHGMSCQKKPESNVFTTNSPVCMRLTSDSGGGYRNTDNFLRSNVVVMDCDNDHSQNPDEWITPEKLDEMLPDIAYAIAFSRHHMKVKHARRPRPKFHVYFQIEPVTDADQYAALKKEIQKMFPFFDDNALDAARFIYGSESR